MKVYTIAEHGLPTDDSGDLKPELTGRVAFIFDGCVVSGWPLYNIHLRYPENNYAIYTVNDWEADTDVGKSGVFTGVEKYVIFEKPIWEL